MDSGLSFDASSEVGGRTWPLRLEVVLYKVRGVNRSVWGEGVKRAEPQREQSETAGTLSLP